MKAVDLLNDPAHHKFYADAVYPTHDEVILAYRVFFQLLKNEDIIKFKNNQEFWTECCKYFTNIENNEIGIYHFNTKLLT